MNLFDKISLVFIDMFIWFSSSVFSITTLVFSFEQQALVYLFGNADGLTLCVCNNSGVLLANVII